MTGAAIIRMWHNVPDNTYEVETRCEIGVWQALADETGRPIDFTGELIEASRTNGERRLFGRIEAAIRKLREISG